MHALYTHIGIYIYTYYIYIYILYLYIYTLIFVLTVTLCTTPADSAALCGELGFRRAPGSPRHFINLVPISEDETMKNWPLLEGGNSRLILVLSAICSMELDGSSAASKRHTGW